MDALRAELRASRDRTQRLERRVDALETSEALGRGLGSASWKSASRNGDDPSLAIPELAVIRLKPKREPAPKLDTEVTVVEPSPDRLELIAREANEADERSPPPEDPDVLDANYARAVQAIRTGNLEGGAERLETFAREHPKHPNADNALYYAGVARMGLEDFAGAAELFQAVEDRYPAGDAVAEALLRRAECESRRSRPMDARALYAKQRKQGLRP